MNYKLKIKKTKGGFDTIFIQDKGMSTFFDLDAFKSIERLELIVKLINKKSKEKLYEEYMSAIESFIRLVDDKVYFGQYIDDNLAQLDVFSGFAGGEKIFGVLSTDEFLPILLELIEYLKKAK